MRERLHRHTLRLRPYWRTHLAGRTWAQPWFEWMHAVALEGMNFGMGGGTDSSGEREVLKCIRQRTPEPCLVIDVGANQGDYAALALDILGRDAQIVCVEPSPTATSRLRARFATNPLVSVHQVALGSREGSSVLYTTDPGSGLASLYPRRLGHFGLEMAPEAEVRVTTLDQFCKSVEMDRVDLLKLDVEGAEVDVLRGASTLLGTGAIGAIQFEIGGANIDARTFLQDYFYLLTPDYQIFRVLQDGLWPVPEYREIDEVFVTTNYLALKSAGGR